MITKHDMPIGFSPYDELLICSNQLVQTELPFLVDDFVPLLIGKGDGPRIWLSGPSHPTTQGWKGLIENNRVVEEAPLLKLKKPIQGVVRVTLSGKVILLAKEVGQQKVEVPTLDLRPLGLNIYGTSQKLYLSGNTFTENVFEGVRVAFSLNTGSAGYQT